MRSSTSGLNVTRRGFAKATALAGIAAAAGTGGLFGCAPSSKEPSESNEPVAREEKIVWNHCMSCAFSCCPLKFHVVDGNIAWVENPDNGSTEFGGNQFRPCLRGRSIRRWINHADRITQPMKRVEGTKRGDGKFEPISWEEAIDLTYEKLKYCIDTYGNEAVSRNCAAGPGYSGLFGRLMNLLGGMTDWYGTDSQGQGCLATWHTVYGTWRCDGMASGPYASDARDAELIVLFGFSATLSRMGGHGSGYEFAVARENGARIISIDPVYTEDSCAHPDEWVPIRPHTDGALASAICYVLVNEGLADFEFLRTHAVGFDEDTMPESAKGKNLSYKDYLMGTGYDMTPKTPEWASPITQIPVDKIYEIARAIGNAKKCYIAQGLGPQRAQNGENLARAILMVSIISGHWGYTGSGNGMYPACATLGPNIGGLPLGENPVKTVLPTQLVADAIDHGDQLTAKRDGLWGVEKMGTCLKFLMADARGGLGSSRPDLNYIRDVLRDESKLEFLVGSDFFMTSTMELCDLVLPDLMPYEKELELKGTMSGGHMSGFVFGQKVQDAPDGIMSNYDFFCELAKKFGVYEEFSDGGKTWDDVQTANYEALRERLEYMPTLEEGIEMGMFWHDEVSKNSFEDFYNDPEGSPLGTPSGKIEIYSETLAELAETREPLDEWDVITPVATYQPGLGSFADPDIEQYPLQVISIKPKNRYHGTMQPNELLDQANRHTIWINPMDAEPRGIANGDKVRVFNKYGEIQIEARVTPRVVPGVMSMTDGKWRVIDENGVDVGGNVNTLAFNRPSPLAKHNCNNSIVAQVEKL